MKTPEDIALELITQWLDDVDPDVFMQDFRSLGGGTGIKIGEFLAQNNFEIEEN